MPDRLPRIPITNRVAAGSVRAVAVFGFAAAVAVVSCRSGCEQDGHKPAGPCAADSACSRRACDIGDWTTYGRDAQRTSASPGCCVGPLRELWRFSPEPREGRKARAFHAIALGDAVYVSGVIGESPAVFRLHLDGTLAWVFDSRVDISHAHWPTFGLGEVMLNDDGVYLLDPRTGAKLFDRGLDSWGQTLTDASRIYLVNTYYVEGPRLSVGGYDPQGHQLWQQNVVGQKQREELRDLVGGLALDRRILFQAAEYRYKQSAGVFAFEAATGTPKWSVETRPAGALSAAHRRVYLIERPAKDNAVLLVARSQEDGAVAWGTPVQGIDPAAPVVLADRVVTFSHEDGVAAWDAANGKSLWRRAIGATRADSVGNATHIAAATGSKTLIVAGGSRLAILSSEDGTDLWHASETTDAGFHSPILANGRVYVVSESGVRALQCGSETLP